MAQLLLYSAVFKMGKGKGGGWKHFLTLAQLLYD